ncbi:MAG TPA: ATP-binding cassette domain-containing protein [Thermoanaerobaculia bacterium]|nr:ATP-binding cassette domain-containing protein [Thermoanaerobaculia bacterium]
MRLALSDLRYRSGDFSMRIDATLDSGSTILFGPSGSGKTTLLELIAGLRRFQQGSIDLDGELLSDAGTGFSKPARERRIGYVPQDETLFPHLSVERNLRYGLRKAVSPMFGWSRVVEVLELAPFLRRYPSDLSGGEKRRVALGRALLHSPRLLLLDEPLTGLDRSLRKQILQHLVQIRDEFSVPLIYVTHEAIEAVTLGEDAVILEKGAIRAHAKPEALFTMSSRPHYELTIDEL